MITSATRVTAISIAWYVLMRNVHPGALCQILKTALAMQAAMLNRATTTWGNVPVRANDYRQ